MPEVMKRSSLTKRFFVKHVEPVGVFTFFGLPKRGIKILDGLLTALVSIRIAKFIPPKVKKITLPNYAFGVAVPQ